MSPRTRSGAATVLAAALWLAGAVATPARASEAVLVFAAASTANAAGAAAAAYTQATGVPVTPVFDATSRAARQIAAGAPAHVLISANTAWVDWLIACGPGEAASRTSIAGNRLVVAVPADDTVARTAHRFDANLPALAVRRFAIADPMGVPAGIYAREALAAIGMWEALAPRVLRGDSVRTVLAWLETGAAGAGIVYASDAAVSPRVAVAASVPDALHAPILYEAIATAGAPDAALGFIAYLASPGGQAVLARHGFAPPPGDGAPAPPRASGAAPACGE